MQKIVILCDVCDERAHEETPATELGVTLKWFKTEVLLDLCDDHAKHLYQILEPYLESGRRPSSASLPRRSRANGAPPAKDIMAPGPGGAKYGDYPCPFCMTYYGTAQGQSLHVRRKHPERWEEYCTKMGRKVTPLPKTATTRPRPAKKAPLKATAKK